MDKKFTKFTRKLARAFHSTENIAIRRCLRYYIIAFVYGGLDEKDLEARLRGIQTYILNTAFGSDQKPYDNYYEIRKVMTTIF